MGKDGEIIDVPKIRTMEFGSHERYISRLKIVGDGEVPFNSEDVISGRNWLRKSKLDELLQLPYNVLIRGNMSLVGIRPRPIEEWNDLHGKSQMTRAQKFKPGFIGITYALDSKRLVGKSDSSLTIRAFERKYLIDKSKSPIITDLSYGSKALYNVFILPCLDKIESCLSYPKELLNVTLSNK